MPVKKNIYLKKSLSIYFVLLIFLASCSLEKKLARQFIEERKNVAVLLFTPDYVFKTNLKEEEIEDKDQYTEKELDSVLFENSKYLKELSDSIVLERYINNYIDGLKYYGFKIYTDEFIDLFMKDTNQSYVINIAQIELEEYILEIEEEAYFFDNRYTTEFELNAVNFNSWFEINKLNDSNARKEILFATHYVSDDLYGDYTQYLFTGGVKFEYTIDSLNIEKIYDLASYLGALYAAYTFDYIMNNYISNNMPEDQRLRYYLHYNRQTDGFIDAEDEKFERLE